VQFLRDRDEVPELPHFQVIHTPRVSTATGSVLHLRRRARQAGHYPAAARDVPVASRLERRLP
jgi:hypothetical protein